MKMLFKNMNSTKAGILLLMVLLVPCGFHNYVEKKYSFGLYSIAFVLLIAWWLLQYLTRRKQLVLRHDMFNHLLMFFLLYCIIHAIFLITGYIEFIYYARYFLVFFSLFLYYIILSEIRNDDHVRLFIVAIIVVSSTICLITLSQNVYEGFWGRVEKGLYFSTLYIFVTILLLGLWFLNSNLVHPALLYPAIILHLGRYFIDIRRGPLPSLLAGMIFFLLFAIVFIRILRRRHIIFRQLAGMRAYIIILIIFISGIFFAYYSEGRGQDFASSGDTPIDSYKRRFSENAVSQALEGRTEDYLRALNDQNWNIISGSGLGTQYNLKYAEDIHSLYVHILANMGIIGIILFFSLVLRIFWLGIKISRTTYYREDIILSATLGATTLFYFIYFTFSCRGTEYEAMFVMAMSAAILVYMDSKTRRPRRYFIPEGPPEPGPNNFPPRRY